MWRAGERVLRIMLLVGRWLTCGVTHLHPHDRLNGARALFMRPTKCQEHDKLQRTILSSERAPPDHPLSLRLSSPV